jgi:hypothetical protein
MRHLLPLVPFAMSIGLAAALQLGVVRNSPVDAPAPRPMPSSARTLVLLVSGERRVECWTTPDRGVSGDMLELNPQDLPGVVQALCEASQLEPEP